MTGRRRRGLALSLAALFALAGCGSSATPAPSAAAAVAAPSASAAPTVNSSTTASSSPASVASASPVASADLGAAGSAISNLTSYQAHIVSPTGSADLIVIRKPSLAESFTGTEGGTKIRLVIIGTSIWVDEGTGTFVKNAIPASVAGSMTAGFDPGTMYGALAKTFLTRGMTQGAVEQKNGVSTIHFSVNSGTVGPAGQTMPPGATMDIWVAVDGGYLVALEGKGLPAGAGGKPDDFSIEITNINDPTNAVTPPG